MEPLLADLLTRGGAARRRLVIGVGVAVGALALLVAVGVSAASAGGGTVRITPAPPRPSAAPSPSSLLVQVTGAVRRPGLVTVPDGARAVDAIAAAGGATPAADESQVNLAARVIDGQQLVVPAKGAPPVASAAAPGAPAGPVSLSTASAAQLETLPRIGPAMAARIIAWRSANGPFRSVDDLLKVGGVGPKTLDGLKGLVTP